MKQPRHNTLVVDRHAVQESGANVQRLQGKKPAAALMNANIDLKSGRVTVNCPYCLMGAKFDKTGGITNPVDVTFFTEHDGKREYKTTCSKGHVLKFRTVDEWREERQKMGLQQT